MSDEKKTPMKDGWTVGQKGYTVKPGSVGAGYTGPKGDLGTPPTSGSAVNKPTPGKKDD